MQLFGHTSPNFEVFLANKKDWTDKTMLLWLLLLGKMCDQDVKFVLEWI
jgi:hypothetical protein